MGKLNNVKSRKLLLTIVGVLLAAWLVPRFLGRGEPVGTELAIEQIPRYEVAAETSGRIQPRSEVFVSVKRGGRLDRLLVKPGSPVTKDQLIGIIDEAFHRSAVQSALSNYKLAASDNGRIQGLFRASAATAQEVDQTRTNLAVRRSELEQARQKLEDGLVRAPSDGLLSILPFQEGETLPDGARVAVIEDRSGYRLKAVLPLAMQQYMPPQTPVRFWKYGTLRPEAADQIPSTHCVIQQTPVAQSVGSGEFDIELQFAALPAGMSSGDLVNISIPLRTLENVTQLPAAALQQEGRDTFVIVADAKGYLSKTPVEVIKTSGEYSVVNGLHELSGKVVLPTSSERVQEALKKHKRVALKN